MLQTGRDTIIANEIKRYQVILILELNKETGLQHKHAGAMLEPSRQEEEELPKERLEKCCGV